MAMTLLLVQVSRSSFADEIADDPQSIIQKLLVKLAKLENRFEEKTSQLTKDLYEAQRKLGRLEQEQANKASVWNNGVAEEQPHQRAITVPPPTGCTSLAQLGNEISGFYLVKDNATGNRIQAVYCEFKLPYNDPNYETKIGYLDVKTMSGVYFSVYKISGFAPESSGSPSIIPYDYAFSSIGGGMDLATGIFTAPVSGPYFFTFNAMANSATTIGMFFSPGDGPAVASAVAQGDNMTISQIRKLNKGDTVYVAILGVGGSLGGRELVTTLFTGMLIEEDLVSL